MRSFIKLFLVLFLSFTTVNAGEIRYIGSSTVGVFIQDAAKVYSASTFKINVTSESKGGEVLTARGKADIGGVARDVSQKIINMGVKKYLIGKDAIGVWVNKNNPVKNLSIKQLKDIFTGKIVNWKSVGGVDATINIYIVGPESATRKVFQDIVLKEGRYYGNKISTIRPDIKIINSVAADPYAIGQLSFSLGNNHKLFSKVKKLYINNQKPSVRNPQYQITRPLYLVVKGEPKGIIKSFISWTLSDSGQKIVRKNFIGVK
ncbi:MAG: hypothetical protein GY714_08870 [Desulfobacterales bacterium]|nr:hypothetical protein [Desulfobacterales bacterium]MCP4163851.1 hypothetical protein [Deltaproteobacteria bacterium]